MIGAASTITCHRPPSTATTSTPVPPPTSTRVPPTRTPIPPSATRIPPSATRAPATGTPVLAPGTTPTPLAATPAPRPTHPSTTPPLSLSLAPEPVVSGSTLVVGVHTAPRAPVRGTLRVTAAQTVLSGTGQHRQRLERIVVMYSETIRGAADAHGRFTGHVRVTYKPATPVAATLTVTAGSTRTATRIVRVTIQAIP